ncbi:uncharacterized protein EI90DRAFT_3075766 [Cantharellus anzutake]|uniref:uncharacterized protein n=1 Tax=Cantharellus anzutake TaxID=1750568 RepID=UPI00190848C5|nr:uncharacterized protein EI90DRAFT_3075766 [Cantharellus anzutake]KAF8324302.1 hypothetical protein EI90DRAFT_3075766 [Cantharellus anzutake]
MDLMESPLFTVPIILLQTVLEEVRHRSLPLYNRLKVLTTADAKVVVLLTDDVENRTRAAKENIPTSSLSKYVEGMKEAAQLIDVVASPTESPELLVTGSRPELYTQHLPAAECLAGIKSGHLYQGYFNANTFNYLEGSVNSTVFDRPVLLVGREHMNRAVDGDVVVIEVFPKSEWRAPGDEVIDQDAALKNDDADDSDVESEEGENEAIIKERELLRREAEERLKKKHGDGSQPTGRVVGIIKRNWRPYVCHIDKTSLTTILRTSTAQQSVFATPVDRKLPRIRIRTRQAPLLLDQKILVTIDRWDSNSRYPEGHFVRALGQVESKEAEQESLLLEFDVPYRPFGRAILDCLPKEGERWTVPNKVPNDPIWKGREDLRPLHICSIDPPGCQDIDDALHAHILPNGNIQAGVHIADVSHFVAPDTPMDSEAAARGTTVYLVDKRIDMLPALLGTNLCSLRPNVERLAFSVIWELTPNAEIVSVRFTKSVIASKSAFTYEQAQMRKDDPNLQDEITKSIRLLHSLAVQLRAARMRAGALNLASPEVRIHLDSSESSDPIDVERKALYETNSLVEEFMLLANISVAKKIQETFPLTAVLRRHLPPPATGFEKLKDLLSKLKGIDIDVSSSRALAASLDKCVDPKQPAFNTLVRIMATRCMLAAQYFCSGSASPNQFGHYGLATPIYTHFTSPIRRYADVLVHRQLAAAIGFTSLHGSLHSKSYVENAMDVVNRRHRLAQMAGRASVEFYVGLALQARIKRLPKDPNSSVGVLEDAFVIRAFRNGVSVFVHGLGLEGLIIFRGEVEYDADSYRVTIPTPTGKRTIAVFDNIRVNIYVERDRNTQRGKVRMEIM